MLIQQNTIGKLIVAGLLVFSLEMNVNATIPSPKGSLSVSENMPSLSVDTIKGTGSIPDIGSKPIHFQINSEIIYYHLEHFRKEESRKQFSEAQAKEIALHKLTGRADSLRKAYADAPDDQKDKIAGTILDDEKKMMTLNEEIPSLYEKARSAENQYWQNVSSEEKAKFVEKIKLIRDSIQQSEDKLAQQKQTNKTVPDTIVYYQANKLNEIVTETPPAVIYKIQVGAYKVKMPDSAAKAIKKLELLRKVENYKDEKGVTIYTTGSLKTYQEALTLQAQVKLEGIKTPSITAFSKGKKITLDEAKKLSNETSLKP